MATKNKFLDFFKKIPLKTKLAGGFMLFVIIIFFMNLISGGKHLNEGETRLSKLSPRTNDKEQKIVDTTKQDLVKERQLEKNIKRKQKKFLDVVNGEDDFFANNLNPNSFSDTIGKQTFDKVSPNTNNQFDVVVPDTIIKEIANSSENNEKQVILKTEMDKTETYNSLFDYFSQQLEPEKQEKKNINTSEVMDYAVSETSSIIKNVHIPAGVVYSKPYPAIAQVGLASVDESGKTGFRLIGKVWKGWIAVGDAGQGTKKGDRIYITITGLYSPAGDYYKADGTVYSIDGSQGVTEHVKDNTWSLFWKSFFLKSGGKYLKTKQEDSQQTTVSNSGVAVTQDVKSDDRDKEALYATGEEMVNQIEEQAAQQQKMVPAIEVYTSSGLPVLIAFWNIERI